MYKEVIEAIKERIEYYNHKEGSYGYYLIDRNTLDTFNVDREELIDYVTQYIIEGNKPNINLV